MDRPDRRVIKGMTAQLVKQDKSRARPKDLPATLALKDIREAPPIFQPRGSSLLYREGASKKHIEGLAKAVRDGGMLDPVTVVAFGDLWFLVDGHHRLEAYRLAGVNEVPVAVIESDKTGADRVR